MGELLRSMDLMDKKNLKHLAELARIKITEKEEEGLLKDLKKILDYFGELQNVGTENVSPMAGGTSLLNQAREDEINEELAKSRLSIVNSFPEKEGDSLKIPPVF